MPGMSKLTASLDFISRDVILIRFTDQPIRSQIHGNNPALDGATQQANRQARHQAYRGSRQVLC